MNSLVLPNLIQTHAIQLAIAAACFVIGGSLYGLSFRKRVSFDPPLISVATKAFLGGVLLLAGLAVLASIVITR